VLVIALSFPAGRFHANPWGRHVNEGVAEWPPSPYRLIRALFDAWKRRFPDWPSSRVETIFRQLSSAPPAFRLPPATASHTRSFLDRNTGDAIEKTLIFDAFVVVDPTNSVLMAWDQVELSIEEQTDLQVLLASIN
jgi:CRISPR-associated protein Csb2